MAPVRLTVNTAVSAGLFSVAVLSVTAIVTTGKLLAPTVN
jgi:hypothetical protein